MNKEQAAAFLGISVRTLQRHASRGEVPVSYIKGKKGEEAVFDVNALEQFKENPPPKRNRAAMTAMTVTTPDAVMSGMTNQAVMSGMAVTPESNGIGARLLSALEAQTVGQKILLSLKDCRTLTGLSNGHLREAIHGGKLKGKIIGRGFKVKRADLDSYVSKL